MSNMIIAGEKQIFTELLNITVQKMKFSAKNFFSKCDQIGRKLRIWSHLLKKFLIESLLVIQSVTKRNYYF